MVDQRLWRNRGDCSCVGRQPLLSSPASNCSLADIGITVNFIKKLFRILIFGFLGLIALIVAITFFFAPSDEDRAKHREQEMAQKRQEEETSQARAKAKLETELKTNRAGVIQEINGLMKKQDYLLAYQKANRFRDFNDAEIIALAKTASTYHEEAERIKKQQEEKRLASALQKMRKTTDKIEGIDWYRDKASPVYTNQNGFFLYIGKQGVTAPWLRLRIQYLAEDWLFIESFIVVADGQRFERSRVKFERDNDSRIWEWYDESLTDADLQMIKSIIVSKEAVIRFNGRQYRKDKTITASQKAALQNVLDAYKALGDK